MRINEMLNKKTYIGNIEPNPKEFGIWIKEDCTHMMYDYTNNQWVCECNGGSKELLTFTFDGFIEQQCEKGMNWVEWQLSEYNTCSAIPEGLMNESEFLEDDVCFLYPDNPSKMYLIYDPDKGSNDQGWNIFEKYGDEIKSKDYLIVRPG